MRSLPAPLAKNFDPWGWVQHRWWYVWLPAVLAESRMELGRHYSGQQLSSMIGSAIPSGGWSQLQKKGQNAVVSTCGYILHVRTYIVYVHVHVHRCTCAMYVKISLPLARGYCIFNKYMLLMLLYFLSQWRLLQILIYCTF